MGHGYWPDPVREEDSFFFLFQFSFPFPFFFLTQLNFFLKVCKDKVRMELDPMRIYWKVYCATLIRILQCKVDINVILYGERVGVNLVLNPHMKYDHPINSPCWREPNKFSSLKRIQIQIDNCKSKNMQDPHFYNFFNFF